MNEKTRGGFTRGEFEIGIKHPSRIILNGLRGRVVAFTCDPRDEGTESIEEKANASLIAAAFNAATEVEDMGYNGLEAVRALRQIVEVLRALAFWQDELKRKFPDIVWRNADDARALLARLKG
jgi:hypothetical protein